MSNRIEEVTPYLDGENDDAAERRERQKLRLQELQLQSPVASSSKRRSCIGSALTGFSNQEMTDHYSSCIKLSSENKITVKNAFNLHLIDYMQTMLRKKDSEMTNFQIASCTLDASAKIYASRVDCVHAETYKIAGNILRKEQKRKTGDCDDDNEDAVNDEDGEPVPKKKKTNTRKKKTIEYNMKNLNLNKFDHEYLLDPLYQKMRAAFDDGGTNSLLLNNLSCQDDRCELLLDSKRPAFPEQKQKTCSNETIDLSSLKDALTRLCAEDLKICPSFSDFSFLNWNPESKFSKETENRLAFDIESNPQSPEELFEDADPVDNFTEAPNDDDNDSSQSSVFSRPNANSPRKFDMATALSVEPSDYSYFDENFLRGWAGPEHWHLLGRKAIVTKRSTRTKSTKEPIRVTFEENIDWGDTFEKAKRTVQLAERTINNVWSSKKNTMPHDLHYKPEQLFKLFLKPKLMVISKSSSKPVNATVDKYDYQNANDCDNFCPGNDDHNDSFAPDSAEDRVPPFGDNSNDLFTTQFGSFEETCLSQEIFAEGNLIQQPQKVAKIDIQYARTAKRIDVKKLKESLWTIITDERLVDKECSFEEGTNDATSLSQEPVSFRSVYKTLPGKISGKNAESLSVPIAFVCLLYLANEKELEIRNVEGFNDLMISRTI